MPAAKHILVLRFSAMGDVAMTVPVIKAVLSQNPEVHITFVSRPEFESFFKDIPRLTFYPADLKNKYKGIVGIAGLFRALKKRPDYYALADLHDTLRSKILRRLFRFSGLNYAFIDKGREEKKLLTRYPDKVLKPLQTTVERYADVFRKLGLQVILDNHLSNAPKSLPTEVLAVTGPKTKTWIGVAPFAKHKGKIYPLERTEKVLALLNEKDVHIFLFGGSSLEEEICLAWEQKFKNIRSVVRKINMEQELDLISNLDVMMSMDSAGMHLASLEGVPVVSIWGATHHYAGFLGYGQSEENIVADNIECRPCSVYGNKPCFRKDYACLNNIAPEIIADKIAAFIK